MSVDDAVRKWNFHRVELENEIRELCRELVEHTGCNNIEIEALKDGAVEGAVMETKYSVVIK